MGLKEKIQDLNTMVQNGQLMEAFDKYYHHEVVMQENSDEPTIGKAANRERELAFQKHQMENLEQFHGAHVIAITEGENVTMVEWSFDMTMKGGARVKMDQIAVQKWQDGQIINERFYYSKN